MQHLKLHSQYFNAVKNGLKTFEVRKVNDRSFFVGEVLCLDEYDAATEKYTGYSLLRRVTYVLRGPIDCCGLPDGVVVLALGKHQ